MVRSLTNAPILVILSGIAIGLSMSVMGLPALPTALVSAIATFALSALVFSAAMQFRVSRLGKQCPVSFRLCFGGAPLFLLACGLAAFILIPQLSLGAAFLIGGVLMLNGSAFDRRSIINTPAPALVKAGVQFESAVVLALGLPIVVLLEGNATATTQGDGMLAPLFHTSLATVIGFGIGGLGGLIAALAGNRFRRGSGFALSVLAVIVTVPLAMMLGGNALVAAGATGLIWGEQSKASRVPRLRHRVRTERIIMPLAYFLLGLVLGPRIFGADLLIVTFALAMVTVMRVAPRLAALQTSTLPREAQIFLSWFGGTPGAASSLYLLVLLDNGNLVDQELILTIGAVCVLVGVLTARLTAQPLAHRYLRGMGVARQRALLN